jgi:predicted kinase
MISEIEINIIKIAIENNLNVIVDDTNVNMYFLNVLIKQIRTIASITFNVFDVDVDTCIERDRLRERTVGSDIILNLNKEFKKLKNNFIFNSINDIDNI